jgi:hypothetical protein
MSLWLDSAVPVEKAIEQHRHADVRFWLLPAGHDRVILGACLLFVRAEIDLFLADLVVPALRLLLEKRLGNSQDVSPQNPSFGAERCTKL